MLEIDNFSFILANSSIFLSLQNRIQMQTATFRDDFSVGLRLSNVPDADALVCTRWGELIRILFVEWDLKLVYSLGNGGKANYKVEFLSSLEMIVFRQVIKPYIFNRSIMRRSIVGAFESAPDFERGDRDASVGRTTGQSIALAIPRYCVCARSL